VIPVFKDSGILGLEENLFGLSFVKDRGSESYASFRYSRFLRFWNIGPQFGGTEHFLYAVSES